MEHSQAHSNWVLVSLLIFTISSSTSSTSVHENFIQCLSHYSSPSIPISKIVHLPNKYNSSYSSLLESTAQNLRFLTPETPKPKFIITPLLDSHVQATVVCCRRHGYQIKTRSGGHDFEGLSYTSDIESFIVLDLVEMKSIDINTDDNSAWIQTGVTNGELIYHLSMKSDVHGFATGTYPSVGVGGLISGGGMGVLLRKYGLSADNILDARIVDANGRILDKKTMGEDLFWAIRGGGGASFGVILAWKIKLVPVPSIVTMFTLPKTLEQGASKLFYKWQYIGHKLPKDVFMRVTVQNVVGEMKGNRTIQILFTAIFLGRTEQLVRLMKDRFPELGVQHKDCLEMSFGEVHVQIANYPRSVPIDALVNLRPTPKSFTTSKSDFVREPISESELEGLWEIYLEQTSTILLIDAFGGKMDEISEFELPFPHRKGTLYDIMYFVAWMDAKDSNEQVSWSRKLYSYMAPYVSKSPRSAYLNNRDLDIGRNMFGSKTSYSQAKVWGTKCFKNNFRRLALVKAKVDPTNFFRNEQSIPPLVVGRK